LFNKKIFSENLTRARKEAGLSQRELAERLDVSPQSVSAYENKGKLPTIDKLAAMAEILGVSMDALCGTQKEPQKKAGMTTDREAIEGLYELQRYLGAVLDATGLHTRCGAGLYGDEYEKDIEGHDAVLHFLKGYESMKKLLDDGTISRDVFITWYRGELETAEAEYEEVDDDDLLF